MKHWEEIGVVDFTKLRKLATIREFHSEVTTKIFGFKNVNELLDRFLIEKEEIKSLKYPTLLMTAKDDPIVCYESIPIETISQNKKINSRN